MKKYTIKKHASRWGLGNLTYTLQADNTFAVATNYPMYFESVQDARFTWHTQLSNSHHIPGSDYVYIEGPRKGIYRMKTKSTI